MAHEGRPLVRTDRAPRRLGPGAVATTPPHTSTAAATRRSVRFADRGADDDAGRAGLVASPDRQRRLQAVADAVRPSRGGWPGAEPWKEAGVHDTPAEQMVDHVVERNVGEDGSVVYRHRVDVPDSLIDLPRVGVASAFRHDSIRCVGTDVVRTRTTPTGCGRDVRQVEAAPDQPPYLVPQEFGLRCDTRWLECIDSTPG